MVSIRENAKSNILEVLKINDLTDSLRGSWYFDDFHLSVNGLYSYSDLDLVVDGATTEERFKYASNIKNCLSSVLELRVSVHGNDSLLEMNLDDSLVLNMGEFIAKTQRLDNRHPEFLYTLAKISLLVLRKFPKERYLSVAKRIGTPESKMCIAVKLGESTDFSKDIAIELLSTSSHPTVQYFIDNCIQNIASSKTIGAVKNKLRKCDSIHPWLQNYLISKIDNAL